MGVWNPVPVLPNYLTSSAIAYNLHHWIFFPIKWENSICLSIVKGLNINVYKTLNLDYIFMHNKPHAVFLNNYDYYFSFLVYYFGFLDYMSFSAFKYMIHYFVAYHAFHKYYILILFCLKLIMSHLFSVSFPNKILSALCLIF